MSSHYIQVGKLNIDKSVLDLACPAAGYSETPPDPAIYCPANGYSQPTEVWEPPVSIPDPETEQILMLVDDLSSAAFSFYFLVSSGSKKFELLETDMSIIDSQTFTTTSFQYLLPTRGTGKYYIIRLTPDTPTFNITAFYRYTWTGYETNWRILEAKFYTPNLASSNNLFNGISSLKKVSFHTNMNSLTSLYYAFAYTSIESIAWPEQMNSLDDVRYCFAYASGNILDISSAPWNSATKGDYLFAYNAFDKIVMPATMNSMLNLQYMLRDSLTKEIIFPNSLPALTSILGALYNAKNLRGIVTFPEMPLVQSFSSLANGAESVEKFIFQGTADNCTSTSSMLRSCKKLKEVVFPSSMNSLSELDGQTFYLSKIVEKITLPLSWNQVINNFWSTFPNSTLELTTCNNWGTASRNISLQSPLLTSFNQPTMRVTEIVLGYNGTTKINAPLTEVHIDWANSDFDSGTWGVTIRAELDAAEIDRIFTALPTITTAKAIAVETCPGFAGCTPSIAQAKGWMVTGA